MKRAVLFIACFLLVGCDQEDTSNKPWLGYAWNKKESRLEFWFTGFENYRDCIEHMKAGVATAPDNEWYAEPVGCGMSSNSYWTVWWYSLIHPDKNIECIWRSPGGVTIKSGYGPLLKGFPKKSLGGYCV
jgi:hypothetical protein